MKFCVLDTNVIVSAMLNWESVPGKVVLESLDGNIIPLISDEILNEYADVLLRPKFKFDHQLVAEVLEGIIENAVRIDVVSQHFDLIDSKDIAFYEVVVEGRKTKESYLVTGNLKHFPVKPFVVTPREMLDLIEKQY